MGTPTTPRTPLAVVRDHVADRSIRDLGLGLFLVALVVSGLFGGWAQARDATPGLTVGEPVGTAPVEITVVEAATSMDLGVWGFGPTDGRYVVVVADIRTENDTSIPALQLRDIMRLRDLPGIAPVGVSPDRAPEDIPARLVVAADGTPLQDLGPGMTYRTWFVWQQQPGAPEPEQITVETYSMTWRRSNVDDTMRWFDPSVTARGDVPVTMTLTAAAP